MRHPFAVSLAVMLFPALSLSPYPATAADTLADFPLQATLDVTGSPPWYRMQVPMAVYRNAGNAHLNNIRLFNANDETLPFAIVDTAAAQRDVVHEAGVGLSPLYSTSAETPDGVVVYRKNNSTTIEFPHSQAATIKHSRHSGWLLDARHFEHPADTLHLSWTQPVEGFRYFDIEFSDDLQHWRQVGRGQIVNLTFNGERITVDEVTLPKTKTRFIRLSWPSDQEAIELTSARIQSHHNDAVAPARVWSEPQRGSPSKDGGFVWKLNATLPIDRVKVMADSTSTPIVAPIEILGRYSSQKSKLYKDRGWRLAARDIFYDVPLGDDTVVRDEFALSIGYTDELMLRTDSRGTGLGKSPPMIRTGMRSKSLIFLARGPGPYRLAIGRQDIAPADLPLATLIPESKASNVEYGIARLNTPLQANRIAAQADDQASGYGEWKRTALWATLFAGVAILGLMAWGLVRSLPPKK